MAEMTTLLACLDEAHRELSIALEGCPQEDLWKRPHPNLLSIGELAGHMATAQAIWSLAETWTADPAALPIQSPLIDARFKYYPGTIQTPVALSLDAEQVGAELARVYAAFRERAASRTAKDPTPNHWETWGNMVQYQAFHVAYHTGQIYSARHLLGHQTEDN